MARRKQVAGWKNRIVGTGTEPAAQLLANPSNWRIHPTVQQDALRTVIGGEVGWVQSVIVNLRTSRAWGRDRNVHTVVDGHMRVQLAMQQGDDTQVPVTYVDLDPDEERLVLATFDPIGQLAVEDTEKLGELRGDLHQHHADLLALVAGERLPGATPAPAKAKGLRHTVHECRCCSDGRCEDPECGCYDGDR